MKMIKRWAAIAIILSLGLLAYCTPAVAGEVFAEGDIINSGAYCTGEDIEFMRAFTAAMERDGMKAYWAVMESPISTCYDNRIHVDTKSASARLVKALWDFKMPGVSVPNMTMWKVQDRSGAFGYMWTPRNDDSI